MLKSRIWLAQSPLHSGETAPRISPALLAMVQRYPICPVGFYPGMMPRRGVREGVATDGDGNEIGPFRPTAECYDLDGNRVSRIIHDDRLGEHRDSSVIAQINDTFTARTAEGMQTQIDRLQRQMQDILASGQELPAPSPDDEDGGVEALLATAMEQTQAERNAQREEIPKPPSEETVKKDKPRTTRTGHRS